MKQRPDAARCPHGAFGRDNVGLCTRFGRLTMDAEDSTFGAKSDRLDRLVFEAMTEPDDEKAASRAASLDMFVEKVGSWVGPYRLVSVLGEGGMGIVYLAEQVEPIRRQAALKIVKPGMDSGRVIARFEVERQALALLNHPNIAHIYDAGTTDAGRPYFVMEYVDGLSITEYCDRDRLSIEQRLSLFQQVCGAVQHAHSKGIIHRDLKPSNILVATDRDKAIPKIIDFGVAKASWTPLTERTLVTEQDQLLGTPEYMSPEQAEMRRQDVDAHSDIYSLGAVLYELLAGVPPFDPKALREGGIEHIRRTIRVEAPKTPSTRLTTLAGEEARRIAQRRRSEVAALAGQLRKELEWIPLKAMLKDPSRRYPSALALGEDIQRYLAGTALAAGPVTRLHRLFEFAGSRRSILLAACAVAVVAISIVVGAVVRPQPRHAAGTPNPRQIAGGPATPAGNHTLSDRALGPEGGLIAHWTLDDMEGATAHDSAGLHHGVLYGDPQWVAGRIGGALQFDGVDDCVCIHETGDLEFPGLTISLWVRLHSMSGTIQRFVTIRSDEDLASLRYDGAEGPRQLHFFMEINNNVRFKDIRADNALQTGVFHHVAGTYDGSTMRLYLDGVVVGTRPVGGRIGRGDEIWLSSDKELLDGLLDDVRIYNRALSRKEIATLAREN